VEDLGFGRVNNYRLAVLEDDLVVAQITKSILPFLDRNDAPSVLALDQFSLILGAHLIQQYGVLQKQRGIQREAWRRGRSDERRNFFMRTCMAASGFLTLHANADFPSATLPAHSKPLSAPPPTSG
jgi:hypothetical protein